MAKAKRAKRAKAHRVKRPVRKAVKHKAVSKKAAPKRVKARKVKPSIKLKTVRNPRPKKFFRLRVPRTKPMSEDERIAKSDKIVHEASKLTVDEVAKLARLKLTEKQLDRLSRDIEGLIKSFEKLEDAVAKKKAGR